MAVHPGETFYAEVGGNGQPALTNNMGGKGGFNGGGNGGTQTILFAGATSGGGGGGASDIRTIPACPAPALSCGSLASRLVVAAGGAGGGGSSTDVFGGVGGSSDANGNPGVMDNWGDLPGGGALRGTLVAGGAPGSPGAGPPSDPGAATAGTLSQGGQGAEGPGGGGGGGGGGIYGGGGGGAGNGQLINQATDFVASGGGGGGGGSSSQPPSPAGVSGLTLRPTATGAQPRVSFSWKLPRPTVRTLPVSGLTASTANLHGTLNPNGANVTSCHFTIAPASLVGSSLPCFQQVQPGTLAVPVSAHVAGLKPSTRYTVRLVAGNAQGLSVASAIAFVTPRGHR